MSFLRQNGAFAMNQGHFLGNSTNYLANKIVNFYFPGECCLGYIASSKV